MDRLQEIKRYTTVHHNKQGDRYIVYKNDLDWLIEQAEKVERLEKEIEEYENNIDYGRS